MDAQQDWPGQLAVVVGEQVKHYRGQRETRWSAQDLADKTSELGHPLTRSTIAALESGRRGTVTVADLLVLARALDVPPVLLVFPVAKAGYEQAEVVPGELIDVTDAADWWSGLTTGPVPGNEDDARWSTQRKQPILLTRALSRQLSKWQSDVRSAVASTDPDVATFFRRSADASLEQIRSLQRVLVENGHAVPALPPEVMTNSERA